MLNQELVLEELFKSSGCYCDHVSNSILHPKAQEVFRAFLNKYLESSSIITGSKKIVTRDDDLVARHSIQSLSPAQKLDFILSVYENLPADPFTSNRLNLSHLTKNAIGFISKSVVPVRRCLFEHFGGNKASFLAAYPTLPYGHFHTKCTAEGVGKDKCIPKKK